MDIPRHSSCLDPTVIIKCSFCGSTSTLDIAGPLCISCGRGDNLEELDDSDWPITCNNCASGTTETKMKETYGRENFEAKGDICPSCNFNGGLMWDFV